MSLHAFIDGNNLLHSTDQWDQIPWAKRRQHLLNSIAAEKPMGSEKNIITVVFDGHGPRIRLVATSSVEGIFSNDQDADAVIIDQLSQMSNPRIAVVVTNDKSIRLQARKKGAAVLSCEEFLGKMRKKPAARRSDTLDASQMGEINEEMKKIWRGS